MRKDIKVIENVVYKFEELSAEAKTKAIEWLLEGRETCVFSNDSNLYINDLFPMSDLNVQYSLNSCQGDGLNIYGTLDFYGCLRNKVISKQFTSEEIETLKGYFDYCYSYKLDENDRYCYCIVDRQDITEYLQWELEDAVEVESYSLALLEKFNKVVTDYLSNLCYKLEKDGYSYFYEMSEEEAAEMCKNNGYEFLEDGTAF